MSEMCVYCNESNDFNGEHMFSAGLGGDDKNYILDDCICKECNSALSKLENELMRKSIVGFARNILQDVGRDRGKKTKPPTMQLSSTHIWIDGIPIEALNLSKLRAKILPQIVISQGKVFGTADNDQEWNIFFQKLEKLFSSKDIFLVEKEGLENSKEFKITILNEHEGELVLGDTFFQEKPPKEAAIWINLQDSYGLTPEQQASFPPRFYLHDGNSINYKSTDSITFLTDVKNAHNYFHKTPLNPNYQEKTILQPLVNSGLTIDISACDRALAKNGLNLLVKTMGAEYVRNESFSKIKSSILKGYPELPFGMMDKDNPLQLFLGDAPKDHHVMFLAESRIGDNRSVIVFVIKLYGGAAFQFCLATDAPSPNWQKPIYYLVDFQKHEIKPVDAIEYIRIHCPKFMQSSPLGSVKEPGQN